MSCHRASTYLTENMANVCLIYGKFLAKTILKVTIFLTIFVFHHKMAIVWKYMLIS